MNRTLAHPMRTLAALVASPIFLLSTYIAWLAVPEVVRVVVTDVVRNFGVRFA